MRIQGHVKYPYSARETLKALVSGEGRNNSLLWYLLVGAQVGLTSLWGGQPGPQSGRSQVASAWYGADRPHLPGSPVATSLC